MIKEVAELKREPTPWVEQPAKTQPTNFLDRSLNDRETFLDRTNKFGNTNAGTLYTKNDFIN